MTEPIRSACGNFYAGMKLADIDKTAEDAKKIIIDFNSIDSNKDGELSEAEIIKHREQLVGKLDRQTENLKLGGMIGMLGGVSTIIASVGAAATAPVWLPIAGGFALVGGLAAWYTSIVKDNKAENIASETQQYLDQKQENTDEVKKE